MRALFLCTEIAGYFANCIQLFKDKVASELMVVYIPNGPDAPFQVNIKDAVLVNKRITDAAALIQQCLSFNPDLVYVIGWIDRDYMRICKTLKRRNIPVVSGLDNPWKGSFRQRIAALFSFYFVKPYFTHFWVAGQRQYQFALRLGYSYEKILTGMYVADVEKFGRIRNAKHRPFLLYVGRFEDIKGIRTLYDVFTSLADHERKGWTLRMVGNGSLKKDFVPTHSVEIFDFLQPEELITFSEDAGGFILPSVYEPWGVVVQEFGAAGKPLLLSEAVNSGEEYLIHKYNGFSFEPNNHKDLKDALLSFFSLSVEEREEMSKRSYALALRSSPEYWVAKLASVKPTSL